MILDDYINKDKILIYELIDKIIENENSINNQNIKIEIKDNLQKTVSYTENETIVFNKELIDNLILTEDIYIANNIYIVLKTLFHEIEHTKQYYYFKNNIYNDSSMFYYLTTLQIEEDYFNNYDYQEVETIANINAIKKLLELCTNDKIKKQLKLELKRYELQSLYPYRINNNKKEIVYNYYPNLFKKANNKIKKVFNDDINKLLETDILNIFDKAKDFTTKILLFKLIETNYETIKNKNKYIQLLCKVFSFFIKTYEKYVILKLELKYQDNTTDNEYIKILSKIYKLLNNINSSKLDDIKIRIERLEVL